MSRLTFTLTHAEFICFQCAHSVNMPYVAFVLSPQHWVTGIQGKKERKVGMGTCKNCYLSDSLPVKFTELCKSSHKYLIIVKFFLSHNKRQPAHNSISTDAIHDLL